MVSFWLFGKNGTQQESVISTDSQLFKDNENFLSGIRRLSGFVFLIFKKAVKSRSLPTSIAMFCLSCSAHKTLFIRIGLSANATKLRSNCKRKTLFLRIDELLCCFNQNCLDDLSPIFVDFELKSLESKHKATEKIKKYFQKSYNLNYPNSILIAFIQFLGMTTDYIYRESLILISCARFCARC